MNWDEIASRARAAAVTQEWDTGLGLSQIAWMHSHAAEILNVYKYAGITGTVDTFRPQGVPGVMADLVIRCLATDMIRQLALNVALSGHGRRFTISDDFATADGVLHMHIARIAFTVDSVRSYGEPETLVAAYLCTAVRYLLQWAEHLSIDLEPYLNRMLEYYEVKRPPFEGRPV